jgi:thiosulfate reductase cytochrome b subunit
MLPDSSRFQSTMFSDSSLFAIEDPNGRGPRCAHGSDKNGSGACFRHSDAIAKERMIRPRSERLLCPARTKFPPAITIGDGLGGLAGALLWHFCGYVAARHQWHRLPHVGYRHGWFRRKLLPIRPSEVVDDLRAALTGRLSHVDLSAYNAVQRLLYAGVIAFGIVSVLSGVVIWKSVQVQGLTAAFGGYEAARFVHFFAMAAIVCFLAVHITLAILVPKSLRAMIIGP